MKVLTCQITLPAAKNGVGALHKVEEIFVESTFKELVSRAEVTLPRNVAVFDKYNVRKVFKHGSPIIIAFGYDGLNITEFTGYITEVTADYPVRIKCQDEMWMLRRKVVNYTAKNVGLAPMLRSICPGYNINALEGVELGTVKFVKTNVGAVLEKLKSDFGLYSYMDGKTLVCGKYYSDNTDDKIEVLNLDTGVAENGLEYRSGEDLIVKIKGSATTSAGKKEEYERGDEGGDEYSLVYTAKTKAELQRQVDADYNKKKLGGFEGSVTAYAIPYFKHGRKVKITSNLYPDRAGLYYIDSINKTFAQGGIRQELTLGGRV